MIGAHLCGVGRDRDLTLPRPHGPRRPHEVGPPEATEHRAAGGGTEVVPIDGRACIQWLLGAVWVHPQPMLGSQILPDPRRGQASETTSMKKVKLYGELPSATQMRRNATGNPMRIVKSATAKILTEALHLGSTYGAAHRR